jgi:hypothetical protein
MIDSNPKAILFNLVEALRQYECNAQDCGDRPVIKLSAKQVEHIFMGILGIELSDAERLEAARMNLEEAVDLMNKTECDSAETILWHMVGTMKDTIDILK